MHTLKCLNGRFSLSDEHPVFLSVAVWRKQNIGKWASHAFISGEYVNNNTNFVNINLHIHQIFCTIFKVKHLVCQVLSWVLNSIRILQESKYVLNVILRITANASFYFLTNAHVSLASE